MPTALRTTLCAFFRTNPITATTMPRITIPTAAAVAIWTCCGCGTRNTAWITTSCPESEGFRSHVAVVPETMPFVRSNASGTMIAKSIFTESSTDFIMLRENSSVS